MFIVMKTVTWLSVGRPLTGVSVEEVFTNRNKAMLYIGRKLEGLKKDDKYDNVDGQYPQIVAHNKKTEDWIQYYVEEKPVTI